MNINILTIFPEIFDALNFGVVSKSLDKELLKVKTFWDTQIYHLIEKKTREKNFPGNTFLNTE